jgi:two-component system cell cycle sensor histidine kinase/response regulator CckA
MPRGSSGWRGHDARTCPVRAARALRAQRARVGAPRLERQGRSRRGHPRRERARGTDRRDWVYRGSMGRAVDYGRLFEGALDAQLVLDAAATVVTASDGYLRAIGRARGEVTGRAIVDLPPYVGAPARAARLGEALAAMREADLHTTVVRLEDPAQVGPAPWSRATLRSVRDASGQIECVVHALETTAGDPARPETDGERRLRKLVEQAYDVLVLFDANGRIDYVSPAIQRILGFTEEEAIAIGVVGRVHPDDRARFSDEVHRLMGEPGGRLLARFRARHRDGSYRVLENTAVNRLDDPDVAAIISTFRDVTEQVELQDELRRGAERLRIALHAARAISWDWDLATRRGTFSSDLGEFLGLEPGLRYENVSQPQYVHPEDRETLSAAWRRCLETDGVFDVEYRGLPAGDQTRRYAGHGLAWRDADNQVVRVVGVTWDVTERFRLLEEQRLLEQRMRESQKLESLGVLAGGIAHDFSNLLMVILGNVGLLQCELGEASPALTHVESIEEATRRATELCRQLLAYAGKGRFVLERTSIMRLIEETTHLLRVSISKKAALNFHLDERAPPVVADVTQIRQVLMNLVMNASDAIGDRNGAISIATGVVHADRAYLDATFLAPDVPPGDYVFIEVSDTGCGMSPETQARIFDPFFTTKVTGRGLGLAAVLGIVRGHRGALKVHSDLGKGSSFKLLLPAASGVPESRQASRARVEAFGAGGTILIVDDEAAVRDVASALLQQLGFRTRLAANGDVALAVYREHADEIVCVLMDLTMPGLDGAETFRELRRIRPDVRVLLMSGYNEQDAIAGFAGRGLAGFVQKPFTFDELERRLRALLA